MLSSYAMLLLSTAMLLLTTLCSYALVTDLSAMVLRYGPTDLYPMLLRYAPTAGFGVSRALEELQGQFKALQ
eukprot:3402060-Rhodomonas_salina.1